MGRFVGHPFTVQGRGELQIGTKVLQCISQNYQTLEFGTHEAERS